MPFRVYGVWLVPLKATKQCSYNETEVLLRSPITVPVKPTATTKVIKERDIFLPSSVKITHVTRLCVSQEPDCGKSIVEWALTCIEMLVVLPEEKLVRSVSTI